MKVSKGLGLRVEVLYRGVACKKGDNGLSLGGCSVLVYSGCLHESKQRFGFEGGGPI